MTYLQCMKQRSSRRHFLKKAIGGGLTLSLTSQTVDAAAAHLAPNMVLRADAERKFVPVMLTPYKSDLSIDFDGLSRLTDFYLRSGAKGFFANCLSSEMYDLDNKERLAIATHVVKHVKGKFPVVATGSFGSTIEERAEFTKRMFDTGVNAVILITSHFADKSESDDILWRNLEQYLKLTGNISLGTYECPSPYKRILSREVLKNLLSANRLIYHKDTSLNLESIREKLEVAKGSKLELYDAHTPNALGSLQMGARGMSCIAGNLYPEMFAWMCEKVGNKKYSADLEWLQEELTTADRIISDGYSLSAKFFLRKRGLPIEVNSRKRNAPLTALQQKNLDMMYERVQGWHERLGIKT